MEGERYNDTCMYVSVCISDALLQSCIPKSNLSSSIANVLVVAKSDFCFVLCVFFSPIFDGFRYFRDLYSWLDYSFVCRPASHPSNLEYFCCEVKHEIKAIWFCV